MHRGLVCVFPSATARLLPVADGGEGMTSIVTHATNGRLIKHSARDPLGRPVTAFFGLSGDGNTAFVESAAASGLGLLAPHERNPLLASSAGTGDLILAALDALHADKSNAPKRLVLGLGGSATNDGGAGALQALGVRFFDANGHSLPQGGGALAALAAMDMAGIHPLLEKTQILLAADVNIPLCGPGGASAVFGPQKGATPEMVAQLDAALARYADVACALTGKDASTLPGAGAAGGLAAGFLYCTRARVRPGIELVLETAHVAKEIHNADLILTGEGRVDGQTLHGKAPLGVARLAKELGKPVVCIAGSIGPDAHLLYAAGIDVLAACVTEAPSGREEHDFSDAALKLAAATERVLRALKVGMQLPCKREILF